MEQYKIHERDSIVEADRLLFETAIIVRKENHNLYKKIEEIRQGRYLNDSGLAKMLKLSNYIKENGKDVNKLGKYISEIERKNENDRER